MRTWIDRAASDIFDRQQRFVNFEEICEILHKHQGELADAIEANAVAQENIGHCEYADGMRKAKEFFSMERAKR